MSAGALGPFQPTQIQIKLTKMTTTARITTNWKQLLTIHLTPFNGSHGLNLDTTDVTLHEKIDDIHNGRRLKFNYSLVKSLPYNFIDFFPLTEVQLHSGKILS